jgi:hypothetical protein
MRYAIIWFSLAGLLLIAFAVLLRGPYAWITPGLRCTKLILARWQLGAP